MGIYPHQCNVCGKKYARKSDCETHMYSHQGKFVDAVYLFNINNRLLIYNDKKLAVMWWPKKLMF